MIFPALIAAYLLGSIPFGLVLTKAAGLGDVRAIGSGNIGATNVLRTGNKALAALTLLLDLAKGWLAVEVAWLVAGPEIGALAGLTVLLGHMYPIWLKGRGGKGVATAIGMFLALAPWLGGCVICLWIAVFAATRWSSLAALISLGAAPFLVWLIGDSGLLPMVVLTALLVTWRHRGNIRRLCNGTEPRFSRTA